MLRVTIVIVFLFLASPAMAEDRPFPAPTPETALDEGSKLVVQPPSVTFDETVEESETPEIPLDPVTRRFLMMDMDESATISREEYIDAALTHAAERFDKIDANGDGDATPDEYRAFRRSNREWWAQRFRTETAPEASE